MQQYQAQDSMGHSSSWQPGELFVFLVALFTAFSSRVCRQKAPGWSASPAAHSPNPCALSQSLGCDILLWRPSRSH